MSVCLVNVLLFCGIALSTFGCCGALDSFVSRHPINPKMSVEKEKIQHHRVLLSRRRRLGGTTSVYSHVQITTGTCVTSSTGLALRTGLLTQGGCAAYAVSIG